MKDAYEILDRGYEEHKPVATFLLFSGGHDSLTATHLSASWCQERGLPFKVAHVNTGIGVEETREFVRDTCRQHEWDLVELHADREEQTYEYIVRNYGFPAPGSHSFVYRRLKERKIERLVREAKQDYPRGARVFLLTGIRREESERRMLHADFQRRRRAHVWMAPLEHWSRLDCNDYIASNGLHRNPVVDLLHMSGECLCGAFARVDAMLELEHWFPDTGAYIHGLGQQVGARGHVNCLWGLPAQFAFQPYPEQGLLFSPLCVGCENNR